MSAEAGSSASGLKLDDRIDIQWQKVIDDRDDWSSEIKISDATWEITKTGEKYRFASSYGKIVDDEDRRWITRALEGDGPVVVVSPYVARVNEIQTNDQREPQVIKIEVMTGPDAEAFLRTEKTGEHIDTLKKNWLPILIAIALAWWWFF
ncbi:hypothetical protein [Agrobacterium larrymoorei]|uniref:Uncharacterized protein n=1 Tax=Agrobacterium larrymoorei TaxID=160699 RepID=A0ABX8TC68_9HYPH|nr:hypothetical protein [Agrobacterium larrymoorei]QYA10844.1 hypothetical protein J5285_25805 [Agrobacterium larrymoorei]